MDEGRKGSFSVRDDTEENMKNEPRTMNKKEDVLRGIERLDARARVYTIIFLLLLAAAVVFGLRDNRRTVTAEGDHDYPVAYSALSGTDAWVSPGDVELRADSYLAQFREFDRTYCFEYWMQSQLILADHPDYVRDEERTAQAREDYDRYIILVRTAAEEHRAFAEKLVICGTLAGLALLPAVLLAVSRLRRMMLRQRLYSEEYSSCTEE